MHRRVYLAGKFERKDEIAVYARSFIDSGISVTSSWLNSFYRSNSEAKFSELERSAMADISDIDYSDAFVLFAELEPTSSYSRIFEFGYAMAKKKTCIVIAPRPIESCLETIFYLLPSVHHVNSVDSAIAILQMSEPEEEKFVHSGIGESLGS